jgi:hypothetical protein
MCVLCVTSAIHLRTAGEKRRHGIIGQGDRVKALEHAVQFIEQQFPGLFEEIPVFPIEFEKRKSFLQLAAHDLHPVSNSQVPFMG